MSKRPELQLPPDLFYDEKEARKYTQSSRMIEIQSEMANRALELLAMDGEEDSSALILDIGCGSGLSGCCIGEMGHNWIGIDINKNMLDVALGRAEDGDLVLGDMGLGMPFRPGTFDGVISVSALQWLCHSFQTSHNPHQRLYKLFSTLYMAMARGARAVFQFYPGNPAEIELITHQAMRAGFTGGVVIDYPNSTKAKKMYLVLFTAAPPGGPRLPVGLGVGRVMEVDGADGEAVFGRERNDQWKRRKKTKSRVTPGSKSWIVSKKERWRKQGRGVRSDSKFTGRRRPAKF